MRFLKPVLFVAAVFFLFFFWLHKIPLWSSDEGRYAEIAREMLERHDFIVPHFNYVPFLDKPVLAPILTAISFAFFGLNSFAARLPIVVAALAGIGLCYGFTRRLFGHETAGISAVILATSIGYVLVGRFAVIDMLMTFALSGALFCLAGGYFEKQRAYYLLAYVFMGVAFLTKGLIGIVLPLGIFFVYLLWIRNFSEVKRMALGWGILIVAAIALPWCFLIAKKVPDFFDVFILQQHFSRFATGSYGRSRPFWFFLPILIGVAFPWSFFIPASVMAALKAPDQTMRKKLCFLLCWIAGIVLFFSIPRSKLPYYILPVSMPFAILTANFFKTWAAKVSEGQKEQGAEWSVKILFGLGVIAFLGGNIFTLFSVKDASVMALKTVLRVGTFMILLGTFFAFRALGKREIGKVLYSLAGMIYAGLIVTILGMGILSPFQSSFGFAEVIRREARPEDTVAVYASPDRFSDLPFYLQRRIVVVGTDRGTLKEQSEKTSVASENKNWFISVEEFVPRFNSGQKRIFWVIKKKELNQLNQMGLEGYRILGEDPRHLLITNS